MDSIIDHTGRRTIGQVNALTGSSRSERRLEAILEAATRVFLNNGYSHTSIDRIVEEAGGSKATIYKYFTNKRELFNAVIDRIVTRRSQADIDIDDPEPMRALLDFARRRVDVVFSQEHIALMRLIVAEGPNSPEIAEAYYEHGPAQSYRTLARYFRVLNERGIMDITNPDEAAERFSALLMYRWYVRKLTGCARTPGSEELENDIHSAVKAFMQLYQV